MSSPLHFLDQSLFVVLPYLSLFTFVFVAFQRYRAQTFTYSSLSSQLLENQKHFWGLVPLHYGIIAVLAGHLIAFLIPRQVLLWNSQPLRLYILEVTGLILALLTLVGLLSAVVRRVQVKKVRQVTSRGDWILYLLLAVQVISGISVAILYPWGSSWFAISATPYLRSLLTLNPEIHYITVLPFLVQLHIVNAFLILGFLPFTRLIHILVVPIPYLWRKPQVVRWVRTLEGL